MKPKRIVIHHSASARNTSVATIRRWHLKRGFSDIGYHYIVNVVAGKVTVTRGRHVNTVGAHIKGKNTGSVGICICGDNTREQHRWIPGQVEEARRIIESLCIVFGPLPVFGHKDLGVTLTECPGFDTLPDTLRTA